MCIRDRLLTLKFIHMSKKNYFKERIMLLILLFAFMTPFGALAHTIQLTGLVTDAANEPIIGASVVCLLYTSPLKKKVT